MKDSIWPRNPDKFRKECKRLRALCLRIIHNEESVIDGSLKMLSYRIWMKEKMNSTWDVFETVNQKTLNLPVGSVRSQWDPQILAEKEKELDLIMKAFALPVRRASEQIRTDYEQYVAPSALANEGDRDADGRSS